MNYELCLRTITLRIAALTFANRNSSGLPKVAVPGDRPDPDKDTRDPINIRGIKGARSNLNGHFTSTGMLLNEHPTYKQAAGDVRLWRNKKGFWLIGANVDKQLNNDEGSAYSPHGLLL